MDSPGARRKVLLAEDDPIVRRLTFTLLTHAGFSVQAVANGQEALEQADGGGFDLIVSDATMPVLGGIELLQALRDRGDLTPFVLMSGYTDGRTESSAPLASALLAKPFGNTALLAAVEAALSAGR